MGMHEISCINNLYVEYSKNNLYKFKDAIKTGMIKIGFGDVCIFDMYKSRAILSIYGIVNFNGNAHIGHGCKLSVGGELNLGNDITITAESYIICNKKLH